MSHSALLSQNSEGARSGNGLANGKELPIVKLDDAILLAAKAHRGQTDRAGSPYILHPLRVMLRMNSEAEMMAAVLHDVVEDSEYTLGDLKERGCPSEVVEAVDGLTRRDGESYEAFVQRAKASPPAARVKLADLEDNMDIRRLTEVQEGDVERLNRYLRARADLLGG